LPLPDQTIGCGYRTAQRAGNSQGFQLSAQSGGQSLGGSLTSVRQGTNPNLGGRHYAADSLRNGLTGLHGRETSFKRINGNGNVHVVPPSPSIHKWLTLL